jgi:hypothetical protein
VTGSTGRDVRLSAAVVAGLLLLVWATVSGPPEFFGSGVQRFQGDDPVPTPSAAPTAPTDEPAPSNADQQPRPEDVEGLGDLLLWTAMLLLVVLLAVFLSWVLFQRWRPPPGRPDDDFEVLPEVPDLAETLARDADRQLAAVNEGSPRNGIVRCWLRLEESVAEAGLPREPWETSAELTLRVLRTLDVDPRALGTLAVLYREARFSDHELDEDARARAYAALRAMHDDLRDPSAARGGS